MSREAHARFCERVRGKFPRPTRPMNKTDPDGMEESEIRRMANSGASIGAKMIGIAKELGKDPKRWRSCTTGTCNLFVGADIKLSTGSTPWKGATPDVHGINEALKNSKDWQKVWTRDPKDTDSASIRKFEKFQPHDGDVVIWDNQKIQHTAVMDADRKTYYAGSRTTASGYNSTDVSNYTGTPDRPTNYASPTVIYRHRKSDK